MVARGLVTREPCASDRRGAFVTITDEGRDAIRQAAPGHVATVRRAFLDHLTGDELDALGAAATKVLDALTADD
jgi:DNA-binding MarR family transcriptional regulator